MRFQLFNLYLWHLSRAAVVQSVDFAFVVDVVKRDIDHVDEDDRDRSEHFRVQLISVLFVDQLCS